MIAEGLTKLMPVMLTVGGMTAAGSKVPELMTKAANIAKGGVTYLVLRSVRDAIMLRDQMNMDIPEPGNSDALRDFITEAAVMTIGDDPTLDMWGNPYELHGVDSQTMAVLSLGPNGYYDGNCFGEEGSAHEVSESDILALEQELKAAEAQQAAIEAGEAVPEEGVPEEGPAPSINDDLCVAVRLDHIAEY